MNYPLMTQTMNKGKSVKDKDSKQQVINQTIDKLTEVIKCKIKEWALIAVINNNDSSYQSIISNKIKQLIYVYLNGLIKYCSL